MLKSYHMCQNPIIIPNGRKFQFQRGIQRHWFVVHPQNPSIQNYLHVSIEIIALIAAVINVIQDVQCVNRLFQR